MPDGSDQGAAGAARLARARSRSVFIATPIARHPVTQYSMALARTLCVLLDLGIEARVQYVRGNSNLPRARNELVADFLSRPAFTDLLFIDDDMGWEPDAVVRLLASDKDVIGGVGCKKTDRPDSDMSKWCMRPCTPFRQDAFGEIEVEAIGTGFLRIARPVFEALAEAHPDWKAHGWAAMSEAQRACYYRFFRFPEGPDEFGEDFQFCLDWRALGGTIWADPTIRLVHVGDREFTGDFAAILEAAPCDS